MGKKGLYNNIYEHDACGVGMVVNINGEKSHQLVDDALQVLEHLRHRGAEGADGKTGDGAGIMLQIPHEFILLQGIPVPEKGKYGTGLVFLPRDEKAQNDILSVMIEEIEREGMQLMHLRTVPTCTECLGEAAAETEPDVRQIFVTGTAAGHPDNIERTLYRISKKIEKRMFTRECCRACSYVIIIPTSQTAILQVAWHWFTAGFQPIRSLHGPWLSPSVCWHTTAK